MKMGLGFGLDEINKKETNIERELNHHRSMVTEYESQLQNVRAEKQRVQTTQDLLEQGNPSLCSPM